MIFHCILRDSKSPQVSRTLLSILAVLNNAIVWMVSTRLPTVKSPSSFNNALVTVPKPPITIGIIVTFMFHSFFNSLGKLRYLSYFSHFFSFMLFILLIIIWSSGLLAEIRWSVCMSKFHRSYCHFQGQLLGLLLLLLLLLLFTPLKFFTSVSADGFSLEFE